VIIDADEKHERASSFESEINKDVEVFLESANLSHLKDYFEELPQVTLH